MEKYIKELFAGKVDKAGTEYFEHCLFVANKAKEIAMLFSCTEEEQEKVYMVGLFHDVLEDTEITSEDLINMIPYDVYEAVKILTHIKSETYNIYLTKVSKNKFSYIVKMADLIHNMQIDRFKKSVRDDYKDSCLLYAKRFDKLITLIAKGK